MALGRVPSPALSLVSLCYRLGPEGADGEEEPQEEAQDGAPEDDRLDAEAPRIVRVPRIPTQREREIHEALHLPHAEWCEHCVRGRARNKPHRRAKASSDPTRGVSACGSPGVGGHGGPGAKSSEEVEEEVEVVKPRVRHQAVLDPLGRSLVTTAENSVELEQQVTAPIQGGSH